MRGAPLLILLTLGGCSGATTPTHVRAEGSGVLIATPDFHIARATINVDGIEATLRFSLSWWLKAADRLEIRGLPPDWKAIRANEHLVVDRALPATPAEDPAPGGFGCCFSLLVIGAIYSIIFVGVTGGPNNGEHPFMVALIHLVVFLAFAGGWSWAAWGLYAGLLAGAITVSMLAMPVRDDSPKMQWTLRGLLLVLYGVMGWMIWSGPEMASYAQWRSPQVIEFHVPAGQRKEVRLVDANGRALAVEMMSPGIETRSLWLWTRPETPATLVIERKDGTSKTLPLGERPQGR